MYSIYNLFLFLVALQHSEFVSYMALLILGFNFIAILLVIYFMISESNLV
jgi:hypothetical protein